MKKKNKFNQVRIIGGKWRSRKILFLENILLRPTPSRIRETLFNWLMPHIQGAQCLDLFAGSAVLGFEAISRGAKEVVAVENQKEVVSNINKNVELLGAKELKVVLEDAIFWLKNCKQKFDIIFLDPPYSQQSVLIKCLNIIVKNNILKEDGVVYFETNKDFNKNSTEQEENTLNENHINPENDFCKSFIEGLDILKAKKASSVYYYLAKSTKANL